LRRVTREAVDDFAPAGGFCGGNPAVMFALSYEVKAGERQLRLAAYAGKTSGPGLCGVYFYKNADLYAGGATDPERMLPYRGDDQRQQG
jgi:hypothetical protein